MVPSSEASARATGPFVEDLQLVGWLKEMQGIPRLAGRPYIEVKAIELALDNMRDMTRLNLLQPTTRGRDWTEQKEGVDGCVAPPAERSPRPF